MSSWGHAQAGLSVRLREASEAGSAGWLSPPCDGLQHTTLPVFHCLPECAQTHVRWVCDAIQLAHPLLPPSFCLQSFSASWSFPMSWLFSSGGRSIGASASVFPVNIPGWFPSGLTGLISLPSKDLSRVFSSITVGRHQVSSFPHSFFSVFCFLVFSCLLLWNLYTLFLFFWCMKTV